MTVPLAGSIGSELNLQIKQGAHFLVDIQLTDDDDAPINTALYTAVGNLRKKPFAVPITPFACTFPATGTLRIALTSAETALLKCGADLDDEASTYVWDLEFTTLADNTVTPGFYGDVQVFRDL